MRQAFVLKIPKQMKHIQQGCSRFKSQATPPPIFICLIIHFNTLSTANIYKITFNTNYILNFIQNKKKEQSFWQQPYLWIL